MGIGTAGKLITAFFTLILGLGLLVNISTSTQEVTSYEPIYSEQIVVPRIHNASGWNDSINTSAKAYVTLANLEATGDETPITSVAWWYENATSKYRTNDVVFTSGTDYNLTASNGKFYFMKAGLTTIGEANFLVNDTNITYLNYSRAPTGYLQQSWARSTLVTVPGLFAIGLLLISVGLFFSIARDWTKGLD